MSGLRTIPCRPRASEYTAIPLTDDNLTEVARQYLVVHLTMNRDALHVHTRDGLTIARPGMILLEDPHGEYDVLTPDDYHDQYEQQEDA
jgi:hypothetical protein